MEFQNKKRDPHLARLYFIWGRTAACLGTEQLLGKLAPDS
jgi:hypothetical protein